jgi:hypothetical protein
MRGGLCSCKNNSKLTRLIRTRLITNTTGAALWREKEKLALAWLEETLPTLKGPLTSDAWLGVGIK